MSKIFKSGAVTMDDANKFFIDVTNAAPPAAGPSAEDDGGEQITPPRQKDPVAAAEKEAEGIIKKAMVSAAKISAEATEQSLKERRESAEKGRKEGYEEGYKKGEEAAESLKKDATDILADAEKKRDETLNAIEPKMVDLIMKITGKLLNGTAAIRPDTILNLIKQGIVESTITGDIIVRVSADDYDEVSLNKDDILSLLGGHIKADIIKDFSLKKMDCIIETPFGNIDCGLDQKYEALKNNLYYILENRGSK